MIELLISIGMVAILAVSTASIATFSRDSATQTKSMTTVLSLRNLMLSTIENPAAWKATLNNDPNLSCIKDQTGCGFAATQLKLYDETGSLFYDGSSNQRGFTTAGKPCDTYSAETTTDCVYHYQLTWEPICDTAGSKVCADPNPLVRVSAQLQIASTKNRNSKISNDSYSLAVIKGFATNSMEKNCIAVSGVFNPNTKTCAASVTQSRRCPAGTVVTSVQADGSLTCGSPFVETCAATDVLVGRGLDGSPICENKIRRIPAGGPSITPAPPVLVVNCKVGNGYKDVGDKWIALDGSEIWWQSGVSIYSATIGINPIGAEYTCDPTGTIVPTGGWVGSQPPSGSSLVDLTCTAGEVGLIKDIDAGLFMEPRMCADTTNVSNTIRVQVTHKCIREISGVMTIYHYVPYNFSTGGKKRTLVSQGVCSEENPISVTPLEPTI